MTPSPAAVVEQTDASADPFAVEWLGHNLPERWPQLSMQHVYVRARNAGVRNWHAGGVELVARVREDTRRIPLPHDAPPGGEAVFDFPYFVPLVSFWGTGELEFGFQLVERDSAAGDASAEPLVVRVETVPAESGPAVESLQAAGMVCSAFYLPSGGVSRGRDGHLYPLIAHSASGCRVRDLEGNVWTDYVMGWGSALLGYARPEIQDAIRSELASGAVLGLPGRREVEVAQLLCEMIPSAEMTLFGKNGSDVCTAAVRMARAYTGRPKVLFSGYSGWQEPFARVFEPALAQPGHPPTAFRFPPGDLAAVRLLLDEHAGQVAAILIEPAAQVEGVDGPVRDADPDFLKALSDLCRERGALLVFDEILTGFRYGGGSVQKATGVTPDLACFGKALSSGMPLSALVGRRDVMAAVSRIFYHPTFKGEAYSFAAAAAALRIYQAEDVPARVRGFGLRLMAAVDGVSRRLGVDGGMTGLPFRMVYRFAEPDPVRRTLMRTLLHQELLKRGVLTFRGFLLPSTAHGDAELSQTAEAYEAALRSVREATAANDFERYLEIPPVV